MVTRNAFASPIILDVGISFGDEGKGRLIPELVHEIKEASGREDAVGAVFKSNGGANSGHTCAGLKLNLIPAGVVNPEIRTLAIGTGVVADPRKFLWESAYIEQNGYSARDRLLIDERSMVSDISHRLLDLGWESYRQSVLQEEKRGSTGRGISPAYADEASQFQLYYYEFLLEKDRFVRRLAARIDRALRTLQYVCRVSEEDWHGFFDTISEADLRVNAPLMEAGVFPRSEFDCRPWKGERPFQLDIETVCEAYWQAGHQLRDRIGSVRANLDEHLRAGRSVIAEFGQAYWLDKRFGFTPNVTASHTVPAEFFLSSGLPMQPVHTVGVCKAYDTKVGTHTFVSHIPDFHPLGKKLSNLEFGVTTGRQRMVGWYDAVEKGEAMRAVAANDLAINKLDALSYSGDWNGGELLICNAYRYPDGSIRRTVPRDPETHKAVQPVFVQLPGWDENISLVRRFGDLPQSAKRYVATLMKATLDAAYGPQADGLWPEVLPRVRYIGVGPSPHEIIRDTPETAELLKIIPGL